MRPTELAAARVYLVGGSLGIGLAIARRLAVLGAHLIIFARRAGPLDAAVAELCRCARAPDQRIAGRTLDVTDHGQVDTVMAEAVEEFGPPDVLINCAGRAYPGHFEAISQAQLEDTLRTNLIGCWNTVRALVPHMKERGGYVVNTASLAGLIGVFGYTDYCASKFAVIGFSEALRGELKPHGITVSVLCPPDTATPGFATENLSKPEETQAISARARVLTPDAVATALLHGMRRQRFLIVPGASARMAHWMKRLAPWLVEWLADREIRRVAGRRRVGGGPPR